MHDYKYYNTVKRENHQEEREYNYKMRIVEASLAQVNPNYKIVKKEEPIPY